jgi:hypothetical protein
MLEADWKKPIGSEMDMTNQKFILPAAVRQNTFLTVVYVWPRFERPLMTIKHRKQKREARRIHEIKQRREA